MKNLLRIALVMLVSFAAMSARADDESNDSRIKIFPYDDTSVYSIVTKYGYQTNIVFGKGEEVDTISVGDRSVWQIIPTGNRIFIRPMEDEAITNMTVLTNKHSYQFDLKSVNSDGGKGNIYVAKFEYPDANHKDTQGAHAPAAPVTAAAPPLAPAHAEAAAKAALSVHKATETTTASNYNYTYTGPDNVAPEQVFDDGKSTFIKYGAPQTMPPTVFVVDSKGKEIQADYSVQNKTTLVIDHIVGELIVKSPAGNITIYNEALNQGVP